VELKELQALVGERVPADKGGRTRIGRFRDLHTAQAEDQDFYNLKYELKIHDEFKQIKLPSARQLVETFVSHLPLSNPMLNVIPFKPTNPYVLKAAKQQEFYYSILAHSMQQMDNFILDGAKDMGLRGEVFVKLEVDSEALEEKVEDEDKLATKYLERLPFRLVAREPMNCYPHPDHIDCHPVDMIEIYSVLAEDVRRVFPTWKGQQANNLPVRFVEYWAAKEKCFIAGGIPITDGIDENALGFVPYVHTYSGLGIRDSDNSPLNRAVSLIRYLHDVLIEEARLHAYLDKATAFAALPIVELPGMRADYEEGGRKLVPRPGDVYYRGEHLGEAPAHVTYAAAGIPGGILNTIAVYEGILGKAQAQVLAGQTPTGVEAGYAMALMIGQARLQFGVPLGNLETVVARALEMVRFLIRDVIRQPLSVWGKNKAITLKPEDCEGASRLNVTFEASTPQGMMNEALGLQRLRQGGSISRQTELELSPLVKNSKDEMHRLDAESLAKHPVLQRRAAYKATEALYGAKEALAVESEMAEAEAGAERKAESTGIPMGGQPETMTPEAIIQQAVLGRRGRALRGEEGT